MRTFFFIIIAVVRQNYVHAENTGVYPVTATYVLTWIWTWRTLVAMITILFRLIIGIVRAALRDRSDIVIENAALRQQLAVLKDKHPRPRLRPADR
ncbi:MAG: hypothetical protein ABIJ56_04400, partial [Pseudomonadota bacterium]